MKKLIAQRPVLYLGRTYERGAVLPVHDPRIVEAWLRAESAAWESQEAQQEAEGTDSGKAKEGSTGRLYETELETWKKADLEQLARKMGVDISSAKNNAERAAILAAAEAMVHVNAKGAENTGAQ